MEKQEIAYNSEKDRPRNSSGRDSSSSFDFVRHMNSLPSLERGESSNSKDSGKLDRSSDELGKLDRSSDELGELDRSIRKLGKLIEEKISLDLEIDNEDKSFKTVIEWNIKRKNR